MSETQTPGSLKEVLRFPFRGPQWQTRLLIGIGLVFAGLFIPIVPGFFVAGYTLRVTRQAIRGEKPSLPAWDQWEELLKDGLRMWLIRFVYLGPAQIVMFGGMLLYLLVLFVFPVAMMLADAPREAVPMMMPVGFFGGMAILFVSMMIGWILRAAGGIPLPMAQAHFAARGELRAGFRVREWWPLLRVNKLGYFVSWVVLAGLYAVGYLVMIPLYYTVVLTWAVFLVAMPFGFYLSLVSAVLFGQTYRECEAILQARRGQEVAEE